MKIAAFIKINSTIMKKYKYLLFLFMVMVFGVILHIYQLNTTPPLDIDEYGIAYNAFSIATTGQDEWGEFLPIFFRSFGDYKLPLDIYLSAFFFKLFSPSIFWLRFPSVLFSVLYIPTMFLLIKTITGNRKWAILGAIMISILPYNLYYSHLISASISASYLIFASITFFILGIKNVHPGRNILISTVLLSLSLYAYPLSWVLAPLLIIIYTIALKMAGKLKLCILFLIFFLSSTPILLQFFIGGSSVRLSNTSAFSFERGPFIEIMEMREAGKNDLLSRAFHNKGTTAGYIFIDNYLKHFNISYLAFEKSEPTIQKSPYSPLFIVLAPLYFLGLFYVARKYQNPVYFVLLAFILIAPLPSAITEGAVNAKRYLASMGMETLLIIMAIMKFKILKHRYLSTVFGIILIIEISLFFHFFFTTYKVKAVENFNLKPRIIAHVANEYWPEKNLIYTEEMLGEPQIYPLVGSLYPPQDYLRERTIKENDNWFYVQPFNNLYYSRDMNEIIAHILNQPDYSAIGVFSEKEISMLPPTVCYLPLESDFPYINRSFQIIHIKPC